MDSFGNFNERDRDRADSLELEKEVIDLNKHDPKSSLIPWFSSVGL